MGVAEASQVGQGKLRNRGSVLGKFAQDTQTDLHGSGIHRAENDRPVQAPVVSSRSALRCIIRSLCPQQGRARVHHLMFYYMQHVSSYSQNNCEELGARHQTDTNPNGLARDVDESAKVNEKAFESMLSFDGRHLIAMFMLFGLVADICIPRVLSELVKNNPKDIVV